MMLAQIEHVPSDWLKNFVLIVAGLAAVTYYGKEIFSVTKRREVTFLETPASKKEFDAHVVDTRDNFQQVRAELKQDRQDNQVHASQRSARLFSEMKDMRTEVLERTEAVRVELSEKIDGMEQRVIATLRNTGAIG